MDYITGKEALLPRLAAVEAGPGYQLLLTFKNGERKRYDMTPLLDLPAYKGLKDVFPAVHVAYGTAVWPGDIDICPDTLYLKSEAVTDMDDVFCTSLHEDYLADPDRGEAVSLEEAAASLGVKL